MLYDAALSHLTLGRLLDERADGPDYREAKALLLELGMNASAILAAHGVEPIAGRK